MPATRWLRIVERTGLQRVWLPDPDLGLRRRCRAVRRAPLVADRPVRLVGEDVLPLRAGHVAPGDPAGEALQRRAVERPFDRAHELADDQPAVGLERHIRGEAPHDRERVAEACARAQVPDRRRTVGRADGEQYGRPARWRSGRPRPPRLWSRRRGACRCAGPTAGPGRQWSRRRRNASRGRGRRCWPDPTRGAAAAARRTGRPRRRRWRSTPRRPGTGRRGVNADSPASPVTRLTSWRAARAQRCGPRPSTRVSLSPPALDREPPAVGRERHRVDGPGEAQPAHDRARADVADRDGARAAPGREPPAVGREGHRLGRRAVARGQIRDAAPGAQVDQRHGAVAAARRHRRRHAELRHSRDCPGTHLGRCPRGTGARPPRRLRVPDGHAAVEPAVEREPAVVEHDAAGRRAEVRAVRLDDLAVGDVPQRALRRSPPRRSAFRRGCRRASRSSSR